MSIFRTMYRNLVPADLRWKIYRKKAVKREKRLIGEVISFLESAGNPFSTGDTAPILNYLKAKGLHVFPYEWSDKYKKDDIEVFHDKSNGLNYVMHAGKRLYLKRIWSVESVKEKYSFLLNEQDPESPHCYLDKDFNIDENSVLADIGVAEGIFVLPVIDKIRHAYMFETDPDWIEALTATFAPYKDKVTIVNKFVANLDDDRHVRLDTFFKDKKVDFVKIDVDGAEEELLKGTIKLLEGKDPMKIAICTYHKQNDERDFTALLQKHGFKTNVTPNYMLFYIEGNFDPPYLRRGLIRATR